MRINRGIDILRECETRLREVLAEAAAAGEYESVLRLTAWAKAVAALASKPGSYGSSAQGAVSVAHDMRLGDSDSALSDTSAPVGVEVSGTARAQRTRKATGKRKAARSAYPKFLRFKDQLVKIGWSKRDKKEYQHKAPRRVLDCLVDRLLAVGANGAMFTTDELLPLHDPTDGTDVPTYQVYVCLAWLRHENLLRQDGRQGYALADGAAVRAGVETSWQQLGSNATN
jgi:hypothetical protein